LAVIRNEQTREWHMVGTGLPVPNDGEVLQIWLEDSSGEFMRSQRLKVDKGGRGGVIFDVSEEIQKNLAAVLLSLETTSNSMTPSDSVLFHAKLKEGHAELK
jgi:hypothetical protein